MTFPLHSDNLYFNFLPAESMSCSVPWENNSQVITLSPASCVPILFLILWQTSIKYMRAEKTYNNYPKLHKNKWLEVSTWIPTTIFFISLQDIRNLIRRNPQSWKDQDHTQRKSDFICNHAHSTSDSQSALQHLAVDAAGLALLLLLVICLISSVTQENKTRKNKSRGQYLFLVSSWVRSELARKKQYSWGELLVLPKRNMVIIPFPVGSIFNKES